MKYKSCRKAWSPWHLLSHIRPAVVNIEKPNPNSLGRVLFFLISFLLIACGAQQASGDNPPGRILLWHSWQGDEAAALQTVLNRFHDVYPHIEVVAAPYSADDLMDEFSDHATQGLGPDLLIGNQLWTPTLADAGFIRSLPQDNLEFSQYLSSAVSTLRYQSQLFGLPLSVRTSALYYNQTLSDTPPKTLDALLEQAQEGKKVGLNSTFNAAFWGIHAFGGELLDDQGKIILNQGGFANWLDWLLEAQNMPNMIISNNQAWLFEQFSRGEIAYYVGNSSELLDIQEALGVENVGVAPLPDGPNDDAGPLLQTEALFFSTASSGEQMARALLLADFLTNEEQQRKLAQLAGRVPANSQVRIDRRISPAVAGFVEQSKTAVPFRLLPQLFDAITQGNDAYMQALEGLVEASVAAEDLTTAINREYGLPSDERLAQTASPEASCMSLAGTDLTLWHAWETSHQPALESAVQNYLGECSAATIDLVYVSRAEIISAFRKVVSDHEKERNGAQTIGTAPPDLILLPHRQIAELGSVGLIQNLDAMIEPAFLQRYASSVSSSMRTDGHLFGLPLTMNTMVLYFNQARATEQPRVLGDLLSIISPEQQLAMPYTPSYQTHWGIAGFGGKLFNAESELTIEGDGFTEWLEWLRDAQSTPGMLLLPTQDEATAQFIRGEADYLIADGNVLPSIFANIAPEDIGTLPLPAGPAGPSAPIIHTQGLAIRTATPNQEAALALAKHLTQDESQMQLMEQGNLVPAIMTLQTATHPAYTTFWEQAKTAIALPNQPEVDAVIELGDMIYTSVLEMSESPEVVLAEFSEFITSINGTRKSDVAEEKALTAAREECTIAGKLLVHPDRQEKATSALERVAASLLQICPNIKPNDGIFVTSETVVNRAGNNGESNNGESNNGESNNGESNNGESNNGP